jgi:hypothetical protein
MPARAVAATVASSDSETNMSTGRAIIIGAGPAGLSAALWCDELGLDTLLIEREAEVGGHVRLESLLPSRSEYGLIATWLAAQAGKNGAQIRTSSPVTPDNLDEVLARERPNHVVVATGSSVCRDGFQGWTARPIPGWETGNCVGWDEVATGAAAVSGDVIVLDDLCHVVAPLTAVAVADGASSVRLVTRWPMVGLETILDVYLDWILPKLYQADVDLLVDHFVESIDGRRISLVNVHHPDGRRELEADAVVMVTGRRSDNALYGLLRERGVSVEAIGDAIAPRGTYEAVYEGHRQARKV